MNVFIMNLPGMIAILMWVIAYQTKKKKNLLAFGITAKLLWVTQYLLSGFRTAAAMNFIGASRDVVYYTYAKKEIKKSIWVMVLFQLIAITSVIITWKNFWSLLPGTSTIIAAWMYWQDNMKIIRAGAFITLLMWFGYNLASGVYVALVSDVLCMTSVLTAIWRYDIRKEEAKI